MKFSILVRRFLKWRVENIDHRRFLYILSFVVGLLSALAAVVLKNSIHYIANFLTTWFDGSWNYLYLAYPLIGITLTFLFVKYIVKREYRPWNQPDIICYVEKKQQDKTS